MQRATRRPICPLPPSCVLSYKKGMKEPCQLPFCPSTRAGFSLLELLVVVAILIILTMLYWSKIAPSHRDSGLESCRQNLQKIYLAMDIYAHDNQ